MKIFKKAILAVAMILAAFTGEAATSTINPGIPAQGSPISSAPLRQNFQSAYNDINNLYKLIGGIGSGTPGGMTGQIQFNNGGVFGGLSDLSPYNVTASLSGSIARTLAQHFSDTIYAANYGVVCDGVTNNTVALQNAFTKNLVLNGSGYNTHGFTVKLPAGTCVTGPITQYRQTFLECEGGVNACTLYLANGSNAPLITIENFSSLTNTGANFSGATGPVPSWYGLRGVHINGNASNQTGGDCVDYFGNMAIVEGQTLIENCYQDGLHTEASGGYAYSSTDWLAQEEGYFDFISRDNGRYGWWDGGPHDKVINSYIAYNNAHYAWYQVSSGNYNGSAHIVKMHAYTQVDGKNYYIGAGGTAQEIYNDYGSMEFAAGMAVDSIATSFCGYLNLDCIQIDPTATFWHIGHADINMGSSAGGSSHTFTVTIATPGVFTWASHGLVAGQMVILSTTGALPTGLSAGTEYFVVAGASLTTNTFELATTRANALAGTPINTTGSQSGTQTATSYVNGLIALGGGGGVGSIDNLTGTPQNPSGIVNLVDIEAPFINLATISLGDLTTAGSTCLKLGGGYPTVTGTIEGCYNAVDPTGEYGGILHFAEYGNTNALKSGTYYNSFNFVIDPFGSGLNQVSGSLTLTTAYVTAQMLQVANAQNSSVMFGPTGNTGMSGAGNTCAGKNACNLVSSSPWNTIVGAYAGNNLTTGSGFNQVFGQGAGQALTTGTQNVEIGYNVGSATQSTGGNNVLLGSTSSCDTSSSSSSNEVHICGTAGDVVKATGTGTQATQVVSIPGASLSTASVISTGTKFSTTTGTSCGTVGTLTGGASAGTYVSGASTCTVVLLFGGATGATAPNGWSCRATDLTTSADAFLQKQTASTATTATLTGTTVSGDVVSFSCVGY